MVASTRQSICFIVLSVLKLAVGITLLVLLKFTVDALIALSGIYNFVSVSSIGIWWWTIALPYVVPAIFGFVAAKTKTNRFIGLYMALSLIAMVAMGILVIFSLLYVIEMRAVGGVNCREISGRCFCSIAYNGGDWLADYVQVDDCDSLNRVFGLMYGVTAMLVTGWFICLTASIVCCSACCCAQNSKSASTSVYVQPEGYIRSFHNTYPAGPDVPRHLPPPDGKSEIIINENFRYSS